MWRSLLAEVVGGVAPGLPVAVCGPSGSGRTVLCLQHLRASLAPEGPVVLLTAEPARLVLEQARSLDLELETALREDALRLLELEPDASSTARAHGGEALARALLEEAPGARLVVVDPLTALTGELLDEREVRALVRSLLEPLAAAGCSAIVTVEVEEMERCPGLARSLKDACGVFAELELAEDAGPVLRVTKSRTRGAEEQPVPFEVGAGGPRRASQPPVEPSPQTAPEPAPPAPEPDDAAPRARILLVEDDGVTRAMLHDYLAPAHDVEVAEDGFAAVSAALQQPPDLMVLDLHLPRASGYEVLRVLRGAGATLPVLVVSGQLSRASDRIRALVLGANDLMPKPVQRFELLHKVEGLLRAAPHAVTLDGVQDAEALLGESHARRCVDEAAFRERLDRAYRFGEEFNLPASLVAVTAPSADALDAVIGVAERRLRPEDAVLQLGKQRALLLLVACAPEQGSLVLERLAQGLDPGDPASRGMRFRIWEALPREPEQSFEALFADLQRWPRGAG